MYDRDEFERMAPPLRANNHNHNMLDVLQQAHVSIENVTGHADWDRYLSYLQAFIERTKVQREQFAAVLADPSITEHSDMMTAKIALLECDAQIKAWVAAITLPAQIKAGYEIEVEEWLKKSSPSEDKTKS